jgi:hypothetical protein
MDAPAEHPFTPVARFSSGKCAFSKPRLLASIPCLELLLTVFGLASKAAHKNRRAEVVSCDTGCEMHVSPLLLTPASPTAEEIN